MKFNDSRRSVLKWSAVVAGALAAGSISAGSFSRVAKAADAPADPVADAKPKKLLFFTKSAGYQHSVIDRHGKTEPAYAEKILIELGKQNGIEVTASKDGSLFTAEKLAGYDAVVFMTTGDLTTPGTDKQPPMPADGKQALIDFVAGGKGFAAIHCGSDTFHSKGKEVDPYIQLLGGEFVTHGEQQSSTAKVVDGKFPGAPDKDISFKEEWYALTHFAPDLHVILMQQTDGMKGAMYQRAAYPSTWARKHEKGRVFYTSMGHREDVWTNPEFTHLLMGGLTWITGLKEADVTPNLKDVMPDTAK